MDDKIKNIMDKIKNPKIIFLVGIIGISLVLVSSLFSGKNETNKSNSSNFDIEEYRTSLEKSVLAVVEGITGDKKATVVITLQNGIRYSYADDTKTDTDSTDDDNRKQSRKSSESSHITVKDSSGDEKALIVTENMPEIRGVAVICEYGDEDYIKEKIKNAVTAALDVTSKRVYITGRN